MEIKLCEQCGYLKGYYEKTNICPVCKNNSFITRPDLTSEQLAKTCKMSFEEKEQFKIDYLGHDFDPELKQNRIEFDIRRKQILDKKLAKMDAKPKITCPYCKSTNASKIGVVGRSVSFGLFGFGSGKVGKQWHCNNCKSDF